MTERFQICNNVLLWIFLDNSFFNIVIFMEIDIKIVDIILVFFPYNRMIPLVVQVLPQLNLAGWQANIHWPYFAGDDVTISRSLE